MNARRKRAGRPKEPQHVRRFSDPWSLRESRRTADPIADFAGNRVEVSEYRRGGTRVRVPMRIEAIVAAPGQSHERSMLVELRRRVSVEISHYRRSGLCRPADIDMIVALWQDGVSLREYARRVDRTPAAIGYRIEKLRYVCVRFYRWWLLKHRRRREACRQR